MTQPDNIYLVEGIISCLEIGHGMVDHLAEINKNHQQKNAVVGTLSALGGNDGQAATSVLLNTYGGELTQVFTCLLRDLQNSKLPRPRNASVLKLWALYRYLQGHWALAHRFPLGWPAMHPRKALRTGFELGFVLSVAVLTHTSNLVN